MKKGNFVILSAYAKDCFVNNFIHPHNGIGQIINITGDFIYVDWPNRTSVYYAKHLTLINPIEVIGKVVSRIFEDVRLYL